MRLSFSLASVLNFCNEILYIELRGLSLSVSPETSVPSYYPYYQQSQKVSVSPLHLFSFYLKTPVLFSIFFLLMVLKDIELVKYSVLKYSFFSLRHAIVSNKLIYIMQILRLAIIIFNFHFISVSMLVNL